MIGIWIWAAAALAYGLFRLWYDNWRGPLKPAEIDAALKSLADAGGAADLNDLATIRAFLERDDGREFVMLNLVRVRPGEVAHPETGEKTTGTAMVARYANAFMPRLIANGGHPAIVARKVGGYVDAWGVPADPGWSMVGFMRYRSRRDMLKLATDPRFARAHPFKAAGTAETFSFPTQTQMRLFVGPRVWVALVLALLAALAHLGMALSAGG